jgi:hypothetical protein
MDKNKPSFLCRIVVNGAFAEEMRKTKKPLTDLHPAKTFKSAFSIERLWANYLKKQMVN